MIYLKLSYLDIHVLRRDHSILNVKDIHHILQMLDLVMMISIYLVQEEKIIQLFNGKLLKDVDIIIIDILYIK